jgi:hypothetical protein
MRQIEDGQQYQIAYGMRGITIIAILENTPLIFETLAQ